MPIRMLVAFAALAVALALPVRPLAQDAATAQPTFRARVDLISVDVAVVDRQGRPLEDLRPADFSVKVDGRTRPVVSAQLIKVDPATRASSPALPADTFVSTNVGPQIGRRVIVAVDQTLIAPGSSTTVLRSAARFIDSLAPADYAALLAFPEPGPRVDFTTDKARVRQALQTVVGQPAKMRTTTFNLSLQEAQSIDGNEKTRVDIRAASVDDVWNSMGPMMQRVMTRGCRSLSVDELKTPWHLEDLQQCLRDLVRESGDFVLDMRTDATLSLRRLESYLKELSPLDGPKALILVSAGLVADDAALDGIARLAADARTTIHVVAVDRERERDRTDLPNGQSDMKLANRAIELQGLETIAERTGGGVYRAIGPAEGVFDRLASELSASYVIAVERRDGDPERQRIAVDVRRRGVTLRSPRLVTTRPAGRAGGEPDDVLREALASPMTLPGVPIRLSTFVRRDPSDGMHLLNLAAQVTPGTASAGYLAGFALVDRQDRIVTTRAEALQEGQPNQPLQYNTGLRVQPGEYVLRFAVVDREGRRGVVVRPVNVPSATGESLATSDLLVGTLTDVEALRPRVEPRVDGRVVAYLELYAPDAIASLAGATVTLEIAEGEASPALTSAALNVRAGSQPTWLAASGAVDVPLTPGRYVARAAVRRDGVQLSVVSRPFVLDRTGSGSATTAAPAVAARVGPLPLTPEARTRTAGYVSAFVRGLANVVGQEEFELAGRRITSEFLLVQHPASPRDFLTYRDVVQVNGVPLPDRQERLEDLFLKSDSPARDRVRQITQAAEQHVPSLLNPIFVIAFLQADLQSRFELTVNDAGRDWPSTVKAVTFIETARPTILRGGLQGERDVPVRGTAWIEPETGRVLQTELVVPSGRSSTTMVTRFVLDQRLQIMVPEQMRTQNPNGSATYSNFRRFSVQTETAVETPKVP